MKTALVALALLLCPVQDATQDAVEAPVMKAVRFHEFGGPEVLVVEDVARPEPSPTQLLVRVAAAGVNPVDWKVREGMLKGLNPKLPQVPGFDLAGVVTAVGSEIEGFERGDRVCAYVSLRRGGAYAEYAVAEAAECAKLPKDVGFVPAAATPLAALTAWQALLGHANLSEGQTVLIHGGAGGVGHFAVQLAKWRGARVIATASERNHEFLKELGADVVIDYRKQRFEEVAKDVDVVLDPIGGDTLERSYGVLRPNGIVVSIVGAPDPALLEEHGVRGASMLVQPNATQLAQIIELVEAGVVKPHVSHTFPLAEAHKAHEQSATGHTRGKIVLTVEG